MVRCKSGHFFINYSAPLFLTVLTSCGDLPGFTVSEKQETFTPVYTINDKVDLLFVVDNSGSMAQEQQNLADSFENFIQQFSERNLQFQIGVISTDTVSNMSWWDVNNNTRPYYQISNNGRGSLLAKLGNDKIITPSSSNYIQQFKDNVQLGIGGSGAEAGLLAVTLALGDLLGEGMWNEGFVRKDAFLGIIIISDEDEAIGDLTTTPIKNNATQMEQRLVSFVNSVTGLKDADSDLTRFYAIVAPSLTECPTAPMAASIGTVYMEAATRLNGTVSNVCQDFSSALDDIGGNILQAASKFKLLQPPKGDIKVWVGGVEVKESETNGWVYLEDTQEIEFRGDAIPAAGVKISVEYVPAKPLE